MKILYGPGGAPQPAHSAATTGEKPPRPLAQPAGGRKRAGLTERIPDARLLASGTQRDPGEMEDAGAAGPAYVGAKTGLGAVYIWH